MEIAECLQQYFVDIIGGVNHYEGTKRVDHTTLIHGIKDGPRVRKLAGATWQTHLHTKPVSHQKGVFDLEASFTVLEGVAKEASVVLKFIIDKWSQDNYVVMPGGAYNGNRFDSRPLRYPPLLEDEQDIGKEVKTVISDVPRLNIGPGYSSLSLTTGDLSTPAVGFFSPSQGQGFWLLTEQETVAGTTGLRIEENDDRTQAVISLTAPCVREGTKYTSTTTQTISDDRGAHWQIGDQITLYGRIHLFDCKSIQELFDRFFVVRKDLSGPGSLDNRIPFSAAWQMQEAKYNRENWEPDYGYYAVGSRDSWNQDWQIGWVGGGMATHPLLFAGNALSRQRALSTLDFIFSTQARSGFFYGLSHKGALFNDGFGRPHAKNWHLIRKSSDALYFLLKQFLLLEKQDRQWQVPASWAKGTQRVADAFVRLWDTHGQFGQFIDIETGEVIVGGSACAAIAPGGLALAGAYFANNDYLRVAELAANYFFQNYVCRGVTTGGPGEILQCPDSESAFALLESFMVMYEVTGVKAWIAKAKAIAHQCATWCVSYDFRFPKTSEFAKLDMRTLGTVIANVQNKHSAPGICTLSGDSLFKLYRATGHTEYLRLVQEIAHNIGQHLSRQDRPITARNGETLPEGWINERVNMSDWEGKAHIGTVFYGSCWPEVSQMLTFVEIPGLYVQPDTGFICAIDHVDVSELEKTEDQLVLQVSNPSPFPASVRVLVENSTEMHRILGQNALWDAPCLEIAAGRERQLVFAR